MVPYTLPLSLRKNRRSFIAGSVIILLICTAPWLYLAASTDPAGDPATWIMCLLFAAFFGLVFLGVLSDKILLTEDRISCRKWFLWKEMEYRRITAVQFHYRDSRSAWESDPMLELFGDTGDRITMKFGGFISPEHLPVIYDVLKKNTCQANLNKSPEEFFAHPDATAGS